MWLVVAIALCAAVSVAYDDVNQRATIAKSRADTADSRTKTLDHVVSDLKQVAFKSCVASHQNRLAVIKLGDLMNSQPAQLVNPTKRAARTEHIRKIIAPLKAAQNDELTTCWHLYFSQ